MKFKADEFVSSNQRIFDYGNFVVYLVPRQQVYPWIFGQPDDFYDEMMIIIQDRNMTMKDAENDAQKEWFIDVAKYRDNNPLSREDYFKQIVIKHLEHIIGSAFVRNMRPID